MTVEEGTTFEDLKKDLPKIVTVHFGEGEKAETADVEAVSYTHLVGRETIFFL